MSENKKGMSKKFTGVIAVVVGVLIYIVCEAGVLPSV